MNNDDEFDIRTYIAILRKSLWLILACALVCAGAAFGASSLQPKVYEASSQIELSQRQDSLSAGSLLNDPNAFQSQVGTQAKIVKSPAVRDLARQSLGASANDVSSVSAHGVVNTRLLEIATQSRIPAVAQDAANAYANAYLKYRNDAMMQDAVNLSNSAQQKQADLRKQIEGLRSNVGDPKAAIPPADAEKIVQLEAQIKQLDENNAQLQAQAVLRNLGANVISPASTPSDPVSPKPLRNAALAALLGTLLGVAATMVRERFRDRIESEDDLKQVLPGVVVLGKAPHVASWPTGGKHATVAQLDLQSSVAETYRRLRTNVEFLCLESDIKCIEVVSSVEQEGKSTTAAHLAAVFAWSGKSVILVDLDLRRPSIHEFYELDNEQGITTALLDGPGSVKNILRNVTVPGGGSVSVITSGPCPPNPVELIESNRMQVLIAELKKNADFVIIDSPPVLPVADPLAISRYVDGLLLVVRSNNVRRTQLREAASTIAMSSRAPLLGVVLNNASGATGSDYGAGYYANSVKTK